MRSERITNAKSVMTFDILSTCRITIVLQCMCFISTYGENQPNIVVFLTDHQDSELGGMEPMVKTKSWIGENGVTFENSFVSTPMSCPSLSSLLTGLYQHHTKVFNNHPDGNCWGSNWREAIEKETFAAILKQNSNYTTFYAGKYLNGYGKDFDLSVPPGWDHWAGIVDLFTELSDWHT